MSPSVREVGVYRASHHPASLATPVMPTTHGRLDIELTMDRTISAPVTGIDLFPSKDGSVQILDLDLPQGPAFGDPSKAEPSPLSGAGSEADYWPLVLAIAIGVNVIL